MLAACTIRPPAAHLEGGEADGTHDLGSRLAGMLVAWPAGTLDRSFAGWLVSSQMLSSD